MSRWEKLLERMRASPRCVGFSYDDAAAVLLAFGFEQKCEGGSHRRWLLLREGHPAVIIGLVEQGHGDLKPVYIRKMLQSLRDAGLIPEE